MGWRRRVALIVSLFVAGAAVWLGIALALPFKDFPGEGVFIEIPQGATVRWVSRLLEDKGVVRSSVATELLFRLRRGKPQAGEYFFDRAVTSFEVFRKLADGRVFFHTLTVAEGKTIFQIAELVEQEGLCARQEFLAAASDASLVRDLAPEARTLEGFLFPATYEFSRSVSPQQIVTAMVERFRQAWESLRAEGWNPHGLSAYKLVTLASLVERETGVPKERPLVAGVLYNRLKSNVALQCDPTVIYALELAGRYTGALTLADLRIQSPYNTYRHRGLPPGPIANAGEAALRAVLFPPKVDYFYFVSNAEGGHFFSRTLGEHNANVARYRRLQAGAARPQPQNGTQSKASPQARKNASSRGRR